MKKEDLKKKGNAVFTSDFDNAFIGLGTVTNTTPKNEKELD